MKRMQKLFAIVLTFFVVFSLMSDKDVTLNAKATKQVVYFDNAVSKWKNVYAYVWGNGLAGQSVKGSVVEGNIYKMTISSDYPKLLFKNTASTWEKQTADLNVPTGEKNCFLPSSSKNKASGKWYAYNGGTTPTATTNVVTASPTATDAASHKVTVYYKRATNTSWKNAYIHYKVDGVWTKSPGFAMQKISNGYWKYVISLNNTSEVIASFNNGLGSWDSNNKSNYKVYAGEYLVDQTAKKVTLLATEKPEETTAPTLVPTNEATVVPTKAPTVAPTVGPATTAPTTKAPTVAPTKVPTTAPTATPAKAPTAVPTKTPTAAPTVAPESNTVTVYYKRATNTSWKNGYIH